MGVFSTVGSFNNGTFDQHRSTGTVAFSLLICLGITKFVLLGIFTLTYDTNCLIMFAKSPLAVDKHLLKCLWLSSLLLGEGVAA